MFNFKTLDFIPFTIAFSYNHHYSSKSNFGAIFSLCNLIFVAFVTYLMAKELWEKLSPSFNFSLKYLPTKIKLKDFPIMLFYSDDVGNPLF